MFFLCKFGRTGKQANQWDFSGPARISRDDSEDGALLKVLESFDGALFPEKHPTFGSTGLILHRFSLRKFV